MSNTLNNIRKLIKKEQEKGLTQLAIAKKIGISQGAIFKFLETETNPSSETILKFAKAYNLPVEYFYGDENYTPVPDARKAQQVPVLGRVPAGFPVNIPDDDILEYISLPDVPKGTYALVVKGDSMTPTIKEGDYVLFLPNGEAKDGDVVIALNEWGEAMVKRYRRRNGRIYLVSDNTEYPPVETNENFKHVGKVIDVWRRVKL